MRIILIVLAILFISSCSPSNTKLWDIKNSSRPARASLFDSTAIVTSYTELGEYVLKQKGKVLAGSNRNYRRPRILREPLPQSVIDCNQSDCEEIWDSLLSKYNYCLVDSVLTTYHVTLKSVDTNRLESVYGYTNLDTRYLPEGIYSIAYGVPGDFLANLFGSWEFVSFDVSNRFVSNENWLGYVYHANGPTLKSMPIDTLLLWLDARYGLEYSLDSISTFFPATYLKKTSYSVGRPVYRHPCTLEFLDTCPITRNDNILTYNYDSKFDERGASYQFRYFDAQHIASFVSGSLFLEKPIHIRELINAPDYKFDYDIDFADFYGLTDEEKLELLSTKYGMLLTMIDEKE